MSSLLLEVIPRFLAYIFIVIIVVLAIFLIRSIILAVSKPKTNIDDKNKSNQEPEKIDANKEEKQKNVDNKKYCKYCGCQLNENGKCDSCGAKDRK